MKKFIVILVSLIVIFSGVSIILSRCTSTSNSSEKKVFETPSNEIEVIGTLEVKNGDTLDRDIIPSLSSIYNISEDEVKGVLESVNSGLIENSENSSYKKMEGMIIPGIYEISEKDLKTQMDIFVKESESRFNLVSSNIGSSNNLSDYEKLTLASIVEAECLGGESYDEVASIFLNRLNDGSKLQSCVTAEYALGYQRPYLTYDDIEIASPYNTYIASGLPPTPICSFSDDSLLAASGNSVDTSLMYFYYDYIERKVYAFSSYEDFSSSGEVTMNNFEANSNVSSFNKINKQELYGN